MKVSRTSSSPSSIQISIRVKLHTVEIIEPEMSPHFSPCTNLSDGTDKTASFVRQASSVLF